MKILTVVIPSYNTEKFLDKNIPTFLDEDFLEDIEILIINDGSSDKTQERADYFADKYPNAIRVISKENGGHGSVINKGIAIAKGRYFKVVDGDDWVETNNLARLIEFLKESNIDLVLNPYYLVNESKKNKKKLVEFSGISCGIDYSFDDVVCNIKNMPLHAFTIKTEILKDNNILLTEKCFYDDFEYTLFPIPYIKTVIFLDYPIYNYLIAQKDQSVSRQNTLRNSDMHFTIIKESLRYYENMPIGISLNKKDYMYQALLRVICSQYNIYIRNASIKDVYEQCMDFDKELKKLSEEFYFAVGTRYRYIEFVRHSKSLFLVISNLLNLYKRLFSYG